MSCVENLVWFFSNHMVFRQNLSPLFREQFFSFARMNFTKTSFASFRGGPCHLTMKESQPFIKGLTLNTWDLIHLPDPKVAVCERRAWFRYLSFRAAFATLSRISGDIWCGGNNVLVCKYEDAFTQHNMQFHFTTYYIYTQRCFRKLSQENIITNSFANLSRPAF